MSESKKKVLVCGLTSNVGGLEMVVKNYIERIPSSEVQFDFVTMYEKMAFEDWALELGGEVFHLPARSKHPIAYKRAIDKFSRRHMASYDAVWFNDCRWGCLDVLSKARKARVPLRIAHAHNTRDLSDGPIRILRHWLNRMRLSALATDYWSCSLLAAEWCFRVSQLRSSSFRVVRNAVDVDLFSFNEMARTQLRKQMGIEDKKIYINVGRLDHQKNQTFLLRAFRDLLALQPKSVLLLVGEGPEAGLLRNEVEELGIGENVRFLGFRDDLPDLLSAADCFVMPSLFEGLPLVLVEAQSSGLPCICADSITSEAVILDSFKSLKLSEGTGAWALCMASIDLCQDRGACSESVSAAGYDIVTEAAKLTRLFSSNKM